MRRPERTRTRARIVLLVARDSMTACVSSQFPHTLVAAAAAAAAAAIENPKSGMEAGVGADADAVYFCCPS